MGVKDFQRAQFRVKTERRVMTKYKARLFADGSKVKRLASRILPNVEGVAEVLITAVASNTTFPVEDREAPDKSISASGVAI